MPERNTSGLTFNHAMLYVRDLRPAVHFYVDLLGFKLIEQYESQDAPVYARLQSPRGQSTLALHLREPGQTLADAEGVRLYFEVKELDNLCRKLEAAGVRFDQPPKLMPWGWKHAYLKDPDGHDLSLYWAGIKRFQKTNPAM